MKKMSSTATEVSNNKGPRIIRDDLPIVHVYDHCPFCVRVRFALGVKNIKHTVNFLANDDIKAPTKLIGKKIAPIFVRYICNFTHYFYPNKLLINQIINLIMFKFSFNNSL